MSRAFQD